MATNFYYPPPSSSTATSVPNLPTFLASPTQARMPKLEPATPKAEPEFKAKSEFGEFHPFYQSVQSARNARCYRQPRTTCEEMKGVGCRWDIIKSRCMTHTLGSAASPIATVGRSEEWRKVSPPRYSEEQKATWYDFKDHGIYSYLMPNGQWQQQPQSQPQQEVKLLLPPSEAVSASASSSSLSLVPFSAERTDVSGKYCRCLLEVSNHSLYRTGLLPSKGQPYAVCNRAISKKYGVSSAELARFAREGQCSKGAVFENWPTPYLYTYGKERQDVGRGREFFPTLPDFQTFLSQTTSDDKFKNESRIRAELLRAIHLYADEEAAKAQVQKGNFAR